jgi:hypothetical protein
MTIYVAHVAVFAQSATSCGLMTNVNGGWNGSTCGGTAHGFPQRTIYDSLAESNKTFKQYINLTTVTNWTGGQSTGSFSGFDGINFPDTMMDGVARYARSSFFNYSTFFADAAAGTLPHFSMVMPNASYNDHPCHDIALGERLVKDIYEALRAGPGWHKTLFLTVRRRRLPCSLYSSRCRFYLIPQLGLPKYHRTNVDRVNVRHTQVYDDTGGFFGAFQLAPFTESDTC